MARRQAGFTIIELLVVLFIVGMLAALLLPALQRARSRARGVECLSKLSNLGKALLSYETRNRRLPASGYFAGDPDDVASIVPLRGWVVEVLPELEQTELYERWDRRAWYFDNQTSQNRSLAAIPLAAVQCPVDHTARPDASHISYVVNGGFGMDSFSSRYCPLVQNSAFFLLALDLNGNDRVCKQETGWSPRVSFTDADIARRTGVFFFAYEKPNGSFEGGSVLLGEIRDGQSQTILLSENLNGRIFGDTSSSPYPDSSGWATPGSATFVAGGYICDHVQQGMTWIASCAEGRVHYENANNPNDYPSSEQAINGPGIPARIDSSPWLASGHPGGVNVFMADGSARFLSEDVDGRVFANMVTPDGTHLPGPLRQGPL
jgi:prepilin-type N-terminal cleavage/methylation domain-containing protein/prepilin-type processing-associated H-X9-DG protein